MDNTLYTGANPVDPRTDAEKALDATHLEVLGGGTFTVWTEKDQSKWLNLGARSQDGSFSCGAFAGAKAVTGFTGVPMSPHSIYPFRANAPGEGMYQVDIAKIMLKHFVAKEVDDPSDDKNETDMDLPVLDVTRIPVIDGYYLLGSYKTINMDLIAQALEKGHSIVYGISSNAKQWSEVPVADGTPTTFSHFVATGNDPKNPEKNYLMYNSEKAVIIDDSCNHYSTFNQQGQRILTESFLQASCWGILALIPHVKGEVLKPLHTFHINMVLGDNNPEVVALQKCLQYTGDFPKAVDCTGYFGSITLKAVKSFQAKYPDDILKPAGLAVPSGIVGQFTRNKLNTLFGE